jgi:hypothetical protein
LADDLLKELLDSPLEKEKKGRRTRRPGEAGRSEIVPEGAGDAGTREPIGRGPILWGLGAAVLGALIVIAGYSVAADDPAPTTTTSTTTTVTESPSSDGSPLGLPEGYVAVGDRLGMRVERILVRDDGIFLTVTTVVENSFDAATTTGFQGGLWTLVLNDGTRITSTVESFDALARGTVSVWFPPEGVQASDIVALELNGTAGRLTNTLVAVPAERFTVTAGESTSVPITPTRFDIDAGVTLTIDRIVMSDVEGRMDWSLDGEATANAAVEPILVLDDLTGSTTLVPAHIQSSGFAFFHPSVAAPTLEQEGVVGFLMPESNPLPTEIELEATLELQVTWAVYEPVVVSLPVDQAGVTVLE